MARLVEWVIANISEFTRSQGTHGFQLMHFTDVTVIAEDGDEEKDDEEEDEDYPDSIPMTVSVNGLYVNDEYAIRIVKAWEAHEQVLKNQEKVRRVAKAIGLSQAQSDSVNLNGETLKQILLANVSDFTKVHCDGRTATFKQSVNSVGDRRLRFTTQISFAIQPFRVEAVAGYWFTASPVAIAVNSFNIRDEEWMNSMWNALLQVHNAQNKRTLEYRDQELATLVDAWSKEN